MGYFATFLCFSYLFSWFPQAFSSSSDDSARELVSFPFGNFSVSNVRLNPFDWRYIRVELPPFFRSATIKVDASVDIDLNGKTKQNQNRLPMICFRNGGPPLPDISKNYLNGLVLTQPSGDKYYPQNVDQCYPLQKSIVFTLAYGQIPPGVYYVGFFNGFGPARAQTKMKNQIKIGTAYTFSAYVTEECCRKDSSWGLHCNMTVGVLSCVPSSIDVHLLNQNNGDAESNQVMLGSVADCHNNAASCHNNGESKFYSLNVVNVAEQLMMTITNMTINQTLCNSSEYTLVCYARHNALPAKTIYDYSAEISKAPLVIQSPKIGTWYFKIQPTNWLQSYQELENMTFCYSIEWKVSACPDGNAGSTCTWERHMLKEFPRDNQSVPYIFLPHGKNMTSGSDNFSLGPLLSKTLNGEKSNFTWTYFIFNTSQGTAGKNIHIQILSDRKLNYDIYVRHRGLPSLDVWDYCYRNQKGNGKNSSMFKLYATAEKTISFYLLYAREGPWVIGLRHPVHNPANDQTTMSISIDSCPNQCSRHGLCESQKDGNGHYYSYCSCDREHGGFDCSDEMVSTKGRLWHSVCLIATNFAAFLPGLWALWHNACAEAVVFMASGISSAFYHTCDTGLWCAIKYHVLQFLDFWLSFLAVVTCSLYLPVISEAAKRTIHILVAIITAILTLMGPTRLINIFVVAALAAASLVIGLLIEFFIKHRLISFSPHFSLNFKGRWQDLKVVLQPLNVMKSLYEHFQWRFVIAGIIVLALALTSKKMETSRTYWKWHSIWHVTIYTSAFLFLCSRSIVPDDNNQVAPEMFYELTQQNSQRREDQNLI